MKHYLLVFVLLSFFSKSQNYCNQTTFTATAGKTFTTSGNVTCCTLEKILVCAGTSSAFPTVVADSIYNTMFHRVFLQTNTLFYLKNPNNFDTIFMKGLSIVNIKGTAPGTVTIVKEPSAIVINTNINCTVKTFTCSSITSPAIGCGPASSISEINDNSNLISIYPNPANSNLTINVSDYLFNDAEINLVNILGESVYQRKNITAKKVEIDLNNIPSGIYYITVNSKEVKGVKKLIVTK